MVHQLRTSKTNREKEGYFSSFQLTIVKNRFLNLFKAISLVPQSISFVHQYTLLVDALTIHQYNYQSPKNA